MGIKKKIIAIAIICAMSVSMAACSDKGDKKNGIKTETLSSEEAEQLKKVEFSIQEFTEAADAAQDPVEGADAQSNGGDAAQNNADGNNNAGGDAQENAGANNNAGGDAAQNNAGGNNNAGGDAQNNAGDNNNAGGDAQNNAGANNNAGGNAQNNADANNNAGGNAQNNAGDNNGGSSSSSGIVGTEKKQQAFWMDLSGDYVFDGEFITATFKIKETTANGTYPILIKWLDFSNIKAVSLDAKGIDGSVVVGGSAAETQFANDGSFEVKADSVSGNPGDTVTVSFRFNNNPGICASVFRFAYDSDALEYVSGVQGADFADAIKNQNK